MMVHNERDCENLLDYTKEWIDKINRGGHFPLNDITYEFFVSGNGGPSESYDQDSNV